MADAPQPLRIAAVPEAFNDPFYETDFAAAGISPAPELVLTPGGSGAMQKAVTSGAVDAAFMLTECIVAPIEQGAPLRLAGPVVTSPLTWAVVVASDAQTTALDQLSAARWGVSRPGSGSHVMARLEASRRGWPVPQFVECGKLPGLRAAVASRDVDAFLWEHFTTKPLADAGEVRFVGGVPTPWPCFSVAVHAQTARGPEIRRAVDAFLATANAWRCAPGVAERVAARHGMAVADAAAWAQGVRYAAPGDVRLPADTLLEVRAALRGAGVIETPGEGSADRGVEWYNADFLSEQA